MKKELTPSGVGSFFDYGLVRHSRSEGGFRFRRSAFDFPYLYRPVLGDCQPVACRGGSLSIALPPSGVLIDELAVVLVAMLGRAAIVAVGPLSDWALASARGSLIATRIVSSTSAVR